MTRTSSPHRGPAESSDRAARAVDRALEHRLWTEHSGPRRTLGVATALASCATACWIGFALLLSVVVDRVFLDGGSLGSVSALLAAMLGFVIARGGLAWGSEVAGQRAAEGLKTSLRDRLADRLVALGPTYTRGERTGELVHTVGEGVEALDGYVTRFRPARTLAVVVPIVVGLVVLAIDPWTVTILLVTGPFLVFLLGLIGRRVRDQTRRRERELGWMSAHFLDVLRGLTTLKLFGRSAEQADTIAAIGRRYGSATMDVLRTAFQTTLVLEWGATAATALVAIEASVRLMDGELAFGRALAVLLLAPEFFAPIRRLSAEYHAGRGGVAAASRIYGIVDEPDRIAGAVVPSELPSRFDVRFVDVRVAFEGGRRVALDGCSFEIPQGSVVALVGPTGAGKTTVANVLLRFIEPEAGRVEVGGVPLAETEPAGWRTLVAHVPQHPYLFQGSVADNLRLARPAASDADLIAAASAANAHDFVSRMPNGYDTRVGEAGALLSGGERQRLAIARAFLRDAPLLILDEPTANLDEDSGEVVLDALRALARSRTVLLISHRPEPVLLADRVVSLASGRVVDVLTRTGDGADRDAAAARSGA
ncbi:MAG TPA: thiol reductant ABC exporter subunit CydD [Actinomycetota bacterium]|nr:thiol reductant ABC exporter subunit CydD [Actinomycetota bacterium]